MNVAMFGGSFDPPTATHVKIAINLARSFDYFYVVPTDSPLHKSVQTPLVERYNMLKLAIGKKHPLSLKVALFDSGSSFTSDTVYKLQNLHDIKTVNVVVGSDCYNDIPKWNNYEFLKDNCNFIVIPRKDHPIKTNDSIKSRIIQCDQVGFSSTAVRKKIRNGERVSKSELEPKVYEYILNKGFYQ